MKMKWQAAGLAAVTLFVVACADTATAPRAVSSQPGFLVSPGGPGTTTVNYDGKGWTNGVLNNERCSDLANDGGTGQGVDINAGYLLWVLTANGASAASLYLPDGAVDMFQVGGTFKYASAYYTPADLENVYAVYAGGKGKATLTVSHGCRGITATGAFCSPGFWKNNPAAWNIFDFSPGPQLSDLFSATVQPFALTPSAVSSVAGYTLSQIFGMEDKPYNKPVNSPVTTYDFGVNANLGPYNATAAWLTSLIPLPGGQGYFQFDPAMVGSDATTEEFCPLNAQGEYKPLPE